MQENQVTDIATLAPAQRAAIALQSSKTEEALREMLKESADIKEVKDKAGREQAHTAAMKLKNTRVAIEKTGKAARDDANAFSKAVIDEEKRLKSIIEDEESRLFGLRDAFDAKAAAEKAEAERIERERVAGIKAKIEAIRRIPFDMTGEPAETLADELEALKAFQPGEEFAEFAEEAKAAAATVIESLTGMHERQVAHEAEAARLAAERAEIERQRAEAEERERQAAAERAEQDRIAREAREAEEARLRAEREAFEAERRRFEEERAALAAQQAQQQPAQVGETGEQKPDFSATYENGAPMYSSTTFKENGEPIMLDPDGKRSVFCDLTDDAEPEFVGVDMAAGDDQHVETVEGEFVPAEEAEPVAEDADAIVRELAGYTSMQFQAMSKKVKAAGFNDLADQLVDIAARLASGEADGAIKTANWMAMADADKEMALASHACVSIVCGDGEMGASVLRQMAA